MPTKKIADLPGTKRCRHPDHNPPSLKVFEPGIYEHTCPGCGETQQFMVPEEPRLKDESCPNKPINPWPWRREDRRGPHWSGSDEPVRWPFSPVRFSMSDDYTLRS